MPHGLAGDARLSPTDRLVACALLWWACGDRSTADMSNRSLAAYVGVSIPTVERSLKALARLGYVATEAVKPTAANMTGRLVRLRWIEDPSMLPAPPVRSARTAIEPAAKLGQGAIGAAKSSVQGPSLVMGGVHHQRGGGGITGDGGGPSLVMDKEDRCRKKVKNPKNAQAAKESVKRQRPQADDGAPATTLVNTSADPSRPDQIQPEQILATVEAPPLAPSPALPEPPPLIRTLDRAMVDIRQAASMTDEPINAGLGDLLTQGQRQALGAMTEAERGAFERKSPGMRSQILTPFARGFEPTVFERITRPMLVIPRFITERRPVDRTTPGLVAAVADGDPRLVIELAESLCRDLGGPGDRRRWGALHALAKQVFDRSVAAEVVLDAYRQAMGPRAENRGAVFTTALKRAGWHPRPLALKSTS